MYIDIYIGIMKKKLETTTLYRGIYIYVGDIEGKNGRHMDCIPLFIVTAPFA